MGKERNTGPDYQEILKELEKKDREIETSMSKIYTLWGKSYIKE